MERHRDDSFGPVRMAKESMRSRAMVKKEACPSERPDDIGRRADGQAGHLFRSLTALDCYCYTFHACRARFDWNLFAMFEQALDIAANRVFHHLARFFHGIAFSDKTRERRNSYDKSPFGSWFKDSGVEILRHVAISLRHSF